MITDKELLTMLDLCNMKLEYGNLKYLDETRTEKNHTIYSILEAEINSFEEKQEYNQNILNEKLSNMQYPYPGMPPENIEDEPNELNKEDSSNIKAISPFYNEVDYGYKYFYNNLKEICSDAPIAVERYLRCRGGEDKEYHKFIEEWEILESLDAYNYGKYDFEYKKNLLEKANDEAKIFKKEMESNQFENIVLEIKKIYGNSLNLDEKDFAVFQKEKVENLLFI